MTVFVPSLVGLCVIELELRLRRQGPAYDLSHERTEPLHDSNGRHNANATFDELIYCTIDIPATGEKHARALRFRDHGVTDLKLIRL